MNSNHCHEWPIFLQVVFRRPSLSSQFHFESTESKSLISTQSLFSLASGIKTQTVCPSRIWWLSNSEEGSVRSGKDVLVFLCTAFSISIHNLLAALCEHQSVSHLDKRDTFHLSVNAPKTPLQRLTTTVYLAWRVPTLLLWPYATICPFSLPNVTNKGKQSTTVSSIAAKRSKLRWIGILCDFWCKHFVNIYHLRGKDVKNWNRHGMRGPSNGRDMDRRVVQVSQYLGRSLVSKQQATCNQVLCMKLHRGVYRMRPSRYTLLGPKFETNAPAFSRNTVQVPAVLVVAQWQSLASPKWSISSSDSVHLVYRG